MGRQSATTGVRPARDGNVEERAQQVKKEAEERAKQVTQETEQHAKELVDTAQDTARSTFSNQKHRAAEGLHVVADALRQTGQNLSKEDQDTMARYASQAAERIDRFSGQLDEKSVDEILSGVENFARERPEVFLGGALVLGLFAARFIKSSSSGTRSQHQEQMRQRPATAEQLRSRGRTGPYPA
jgi:hypothetical protein